MAGVLISLYYWYGTVVWRVFCCSSSMFIWQVFWPVFTIGVVIIITVIWQVFWAVVTWHCMVQAQGSLMSVCHKSDHNCRLGGSAQSDHNCHFGGSAQTDHTWHFGGFVQSDHNCHCGGSVQHGWSCAKGVWKRYSCMLAYPQSIEH